MSNTNDSKSEEVSKTRMKLLDFYTAKVENHIGYLISTSLGIAGLLLNLGTGTFFISSDFRGFLLTSLFAVTFYILCRTFYWGRMQSAIVWVRLWSDIKKDVKEEKIDLNLYEVNYYAQLRTSAIRQVHGIEPYPKTGVSKISSLFDNKLCMFIIVIFLDVILFCLFKSLKLFV